MRPWIYGVVLVAMVASPTIGGWWWHRRHGDESPPSRWPTRRSLAVGRFLFEGRTRFIGYAGFGVVIAVAIGLFAREMTRPHASKTSNQMESRPGLPAWFAYPAGAIGWSVCLALLVRDNERAEQQRRRRRSIARGTVVAEIPAADGGWKPS